MIDKSILQTMLADKYIKCQKHPTADLYIYNYTDIAQYERIWNKATLACRGLILDGNDNIVALPLPKFFNLGEVENQRIPDEPFEVYEKMDGSLGISYVFDGQIHIATRGSFISEQSIKATEMLHSKYKEVLSKMKPEITYLFEIIYPENRIVVDYGQDEKLVLLAMIDMNTGKDVPLADIGFPIVKKYDGIQDLQVLKSLNENNKEGFVIKYEDGYRLKVKFEDYVRLHRILTGVSYRSIWESLKDNEPIEELLEQIPDEFYKWIEEKEAELKRSYKEVEEVAISEMKAFDTRKDAAAYILTCQYPKVMFNILDDKDYSDTIWKIIKPENEKPFGNLNQ